MRWTVPDEVRRLGSAGLKRRSGSPHVIVGGQVTGAVERLLQHRQRLTPLLRQVTLPRQKVPVRLSNGLRLLPLQTERLLQRMRREGSARRTKCSWHRETPRQCTALTSFSEEALELCTLQDDSHLHVPSH